MVVFRLGRLLAVLLAILTLGGAAWLLRPEEVGLTRRTVVKGYWAATGEGLHLGFAEGPDGQRHGPTSFTVDAGGRLYVADAFRHRVLVFDAGGKLRGELALPDGFACTDLAVDRRGALYLSDGKAGRLLKLDRMGTGVWEGAVPGGDGGGVVLATVEAIAADPEGALYVLGHVLDETCYQRRVWLYRGPGRETVLAAREMSRTGRVGQPEGILDAFVRGLAVDPGGCLYLHLQEAGEDGGTLLVLPGGKGPPREVSLAGNELPYPVRLAGVDRQGRVYLTSVGPADPVRLWVLSARGKLLAVRELHAPGPVLLRVAVRIGPGGTIYTARSTREGVEYEAWRPALRPRLLRAWLGS